MSYMLAKATNTSNSGRMGIANKHSSAIPTPNLTMNGESNSARRSTVKTSEAGKRRNINTLKQQNETLRQLKKLKLVGGANNANSVDFEAFGDL